MLKTSIRKKLIVLLIAAMLIPMAFSIALSYFFIKDTVTKEAVSTNTDLLFQGRTNIENYLNTLQKATLAVYHDGSLFEILDDHRTIGDSSAYWWRTRNEVNRALLSISYSVNQIRQVYLYLENSARGFAIQDRNYAYNKDPHSDYQPPDETREVYIEPPHPMHTYGLRYNIPISNEPVFTFYRTIYNDVTNRRLGTLALDVNPSDVALLCAQLYTEGKEEVFLLDQSGQVIYSPAEMQTGDLLESDWLIELMKLEDNSGSFQWNQNEFSGLIFYEKLSSETADWTLVKRIPYSHLNRSARQLTTMNTGMFTAFLIIAIAATVVISFRFTNPIRKLTDYMNRINEGDLNVQIDLDGTDELALLGRRFRTMMMTLNHMYLREYQLQIANKTNELKALQAQINPHFLNNVLQSIGTVALQHNDRQIYSLISSLGKMMRYSMNTNETLVTLEEELDYVRAYMDLQRHRFEDELVFQLEVDQEVTSLLLPKMTLQPLVENAFKHAYKIPASRKELVIRCVFTEEEVIIEVKDNGVGASEETLKLLQGSSSQDDGSNGKSIGLMNVRSRLNLFFDGQVNMEMRNRTIGGFCVSIRIPHKKETKAL